MKQSQQDSKLVFFQCLLVLLIAGTFITVKYRQSNEIVETGAFGASQKANDTFSDLAYMLYEEKINEQR